VAGHQQGEAGEAAAIPPEPAVIARIGGRGLPRRDPLGERGVEVHRHALGQQEPDRDALAGGGVVVTGRISD
jgi:hypothetical protein